VRALHTGHTLGWTHAGGSVLALRDLVAGRAPQVGFDFLQPAAIPPR
jgi:D-amino-acid dehydrogenase